jgi:hypothetical protein
MNQSKNHHSLLTFPSTTKSNKISYQFQINFVHFFSGLKKEAAAWEKNFTLAGTGSGSRGFSKKAPPPPATSPWGAAVPPQRKEAAEEERRHQPPGRWSFWWWLGLGSRQVT